MAPAKPAAYVTAKGEISFFFLDMNGNVNAGTVSANSANLDSKMRS